MKISRCVGYVDDPWNIQLSYDELMTITRAVMNASVLSNSNSLYKDALTDLRSGIRAFEDYEYADR